jgi:hypothetical protein
VKEEREKKMSNTNDGSIRTMYLRNKLGQKIGCVASVFPRNGSVIYYAVSVVAPEVEGLDNYNLPVRGNHFSKDRVQLARRIAIGRVERSRNNSFSIDVSGIDDVKPFLDNLIMEHMSYNTNIPGRARNAAVLWLENENKKFEEKKQLKSLLTNLLYNTLNTKVEIDSDMLHNAGRFVNTLSDKQKHLLGL